MNPSFHADARPCAAQISSCSPPRHFPDCRRRRGGASVHARGFSLIEILVSILILSFGLLGMVGMQAAALRANREARMQSIAVTLATELAELVRSNPDAGLLVPGHPYVGDFRSPLVSDHSSYCLGVQVTAGCPDALSLAGAQMTDWLARVDVELPGAHVQVCADAAPFDKNGLPQWNCTVGADAAMVIKIGWSRSSTERWKGMAFALESPARPVVVLPFTPGSAT